MKDYTFFFSKCQEMEIRFGGARNLRLDVLNSSVVICSKLLDFGSGKKINSHLCDNYITVDSDEKTDPTYTSIFDIPEGELFDGVISNQVLEHIEKKDILPILECISSHMTYGAKFLATIPNVFNWCKFIEDYTHVNALTFYHLGALFEMSGLQAVDAYRYAKNLQEITEASENEKFFMTFLNKFYDLDPANFVAVVGVKI